MIAFPAGDAQREEARRSLKRALADGRLLPDSEGDAGSLSAAVSGTSDARALEQNLGIPGGLAMLADEGVRARVDQPEDARAFALRWVEAAHPGADLTRVPGFIAVWMLDRAGDLDRDLAPNRAEGLARVRSLHLRQLAGGHVARAEWSEARALAMAETDAVEDGASNAAERLAETLAWPPLGSRGILTEGARLLASVAGSAAARRSGLSEDDRAAIRDMMEALYQETSAQREADPDRYFFPDLFKERHPEQSARFVADLEAQNRAFSQVMVDVTDYMLNLMGDTPSTTDENQA